MAIKRAPRKPAKVRVRPVRQWFPFYKYRPVTHKERLRIAHLITLVREQAEAGRRVEIKVENRRNSNGFTLRWEPANQSVVVKRFKTLAWLEANGYQW